METGTITERIRKKEGLFERIRKSLAWSVFCAGTLCGYIGAVDYQNRALEIQKTCPEIEEKAVALECILADSRVFPTDLMSNPETKKIKQRYNYYYFWGCYGLPWMMFFSYINLIAFLGVEYVRKNGKKEFGR